MFAMRIFDALHTGQIPVGGITQAMFRWQPQLHWSFPAILTTSGLSYSVAVCATHRTVAAAINKLAFHLRMLPRYLHNFGARIYQPALARDHADEGAKQHDPIADPDPAHQRENVGLKDIAAFSIPGSGEINVKVLVQAAAQSDFGSRGLRGDVETPGGLHHADVLAILGGGDGDGAGTVIVVAALLIAGHAQIVGTQLEGFSQADFHRHVPVKGGSGESDEDDDHADVHQISAVAAGVAMGQLDHRHDEIGTALGTDGVGALEELDDYRGQHEGAQAEGHQGVKMADA